MELGRPWWSYATGFFKQRAFNQTQQVVFIKPCRHMRLAFGELIVGGLLGVASKVTASMATGCGAGIGSKEVIRRDGQTMPRFHDVSV